MTTPAHDPNNRGPRKRTRTKERENKEFEEKVVQVRRVSKTVKGGRKMGFTALVVIGNKQGKVGVGLGKANEVKEAVRKGVDQAKRHSINILLDEDTIAHTIDYKFRAAKVMIKPASKGTGLIAGGATRVVLELAGIKDILSKQLGSANPINNAYATLQALEQLTEEVKLRKSRLASVGIVDKPRTKSAAKPTTPSESK